MKITSANSHADKNSWQTLEEINFFKKKKLLFFLIGTLAIIVVYLIREFLIFNSLSDPVLSSRWILYYIPAYCLAQVFIGPLINLMPSVVFYCVSITFALLVSCGLYLITDNLAFISILGFFSGIGFITFIVSARIFSDISKIHGKIIVAVFLLAPTIILTAKRISINFQNSEKFLLISTLLTTISVAVGFLFVNFKIARDARAQGLKNVTQFRPVNIAQIEEGQDWSRDDGDKRFSLGERIFVYFLFFLISFFSAQFVLFQFSGVLKIFLLAKFASYSEAHIDSAAEILMLLIKFVTAFVFFYGNPIWNPLKSFVVLNILQVISYAIIVISSNLYLVSAAIIFAGSNQWSSFAIFELVRYLFPKRQTLLSVPINCYWIIGGTVIIYLSDAFFYVLKKISGEKTSSFLLVQNFLLKSKLLSHDSIKRLDSINLNNLKILKKIFSSYFAFFLFFVATLLFVVYVFLRKPIRELLSDSKEDFASKVLETKSDEVKRNSEKEKAELDPLKSLEEESKEKNINSFKDEAENKESLKEPEKEIKEVFVSEKIVALQKESDEESEN